jgi:hypothetical protein
MDGLATARLKGVVAPLNFLLPMAEKPYSFNYDPPPGVSPRNTENIAHTITVHDARAVADSLSLDREGFVLVHHKTAAADLYDEDIIKSVYYPECERLLPAGRVHNDYTAWSAPQRVRDLMGDEAEELLRHRFAINNVWRPIAGPLLRSPLALCDAASLEDENLVASDLRYPDRTGEIYGVTFNPRQRWYYFPKMQPDEAVLIRCFDSARDGAARFSAHGAFDDPQTPAGAPPRESIEVRTLVFY